MAHQRAAVAQPAAVTRILILACLLVLWTVLLPSAASAEPTFTYFSQGITASSYPWGITVGPDGNLWFTESASAQIGRITPTGTVTEFSKGITAKSRPSSITAGPDGNLWFVTAAYPGQIGRITPTGTVTEFPAGAFDYPEPVQIATGPDGNLWVSDEERHVAGSQCGAIERITTAGVDTVMYSSCSGERRAYPYGITAGPDGNLWFTQPGSRQIAQITPAGTVSEFSTGNSAQWITTGPDGNLWFTTTSYPGRIGRITPTGTVTEFSIPTASELSGITAGPDGNVWFIARESKYVGRITPMGEVREFSTGITEIYETGGITTGPDGNLWFTWSGAPVGAASGTNGSAIARISNFEPTAITGDATMLSETSVELHGTVNPHGSDTHSYFEYYSVSGGVLGAAQRQPAPPGSDDGSGKADLPISQIITGLTPGTSYQYRLIAESAGGTVAGETKSFTTPVKGPPIVVTGDASGTSPTGATLNGTVNPSGPALSDCHFDYGVGQLNASAPCAGAGIGTGGFQTGAVSAHLSGLAQGKTYSFRLVAANALGRAVGQTKTFQTCTRTTVAFGVVDARGCFDTGPHGTWSADGKVRINGIDLAPNSGGTVELDPKGSGFSVTGSGAVTVAGVLPLRTWSGRTSFDVPPSGKLDNFAALPKLLGVPLAADVPFDVTLKGGGEATISSGSLTAKILGNAITASASVTTSNDQPLAGAEISAAPANAAPGVHELSSCSFNKPAPRGYSCATVTNARGNTYSGLVASEPQIAKIGGWLPIKDLSLSYDHAGGGIWHAEAALAVGDVLPGPLGRVFPTLGLGATFQVNPFSFIGASFADEDLRWHLGPVTIKQIGVGFALKPALSVSGKAGLEAGPPEAPVGISAGFSYTHGVKSGFDVKLSGGWTVEKVTVTGHVELDTREAGFKLVAGGSVTETWGPVAASLGIEGGFDNHGDYQLAGNGNISAFGANIGARGVLSNKGVGACGEIHVFVFDGEIGFKHFWSGETDFNGCDFSGLYTLGVPGTSSSVTAGRSVHLPAGLKREEFAAIGANGAPAVVLIAPNGERLETPVQPDTITTTKQGLALAVSSSRTTYFIVQHPAGGIWRIEPRPGSPTPVRYEQANPLLPLGLSAHVSGHGSKRTLRWRFRGQPGESIRFVEEGPVTEHAITATTRGHGSLTFQVAPGPAGTRHVGAYVDFEGFLRQHVAVASFKAIATALPRVRGASYRQRRGVITVAWKRLAGAGHFELTLAMNTGALRYLIPATQAHAAITLPAGSKVRSVSITTTTTRGLTGPAATARRLR